MGSSIAAWYNVWLLNKYAGNCGDFIIFTKTKNCIYKVGVSAFIMTLTLFLANYFCQELYYSNSVGVKILALFFTIFIAGMVYMLILYFFKIHLIFRKKADG